MRVALIGYGAVANIHARVLSSLENITVSCVFGPDVQKATAFARRHGIETAYADLHKALAGVDAAIVASPSDFHATQTVEALDAGVHVLVELPACVSSSEACVMGGKASRRGLTLMCAHTSRYLAPYRAIREYLTRGCLGTCQQVHYLRHVILASRSWADDALLHHASHAIDLLLEWFKDIVPVGCVAFPPDHKRQSVSLLAISGQGFPISVVVSYAATRARTEMVLVGSKDMFVTDGFSFIHSNHPGTQFSWMPDEVYERAIFDQDQVFTQACRGASEPAPWAGTLALVERMEKFSKLIVER
jgi:predicted dehydrogenase